MTDSTASIPRELCQALDITVVPVTIHFGADTFIDGVDPAEQFYERLEKSEQTPTTSTPSPGAFLEVYQKLAREATTIISIHIMETKSALINVARMAADMVPGVQIHVIDSQTTTLGMGLLTIAAARAVQAGKTEGEVLAALERMIPRVDAFAAIRDLTQLRRSGRVSLGAAMVAGMLSIKPILTIGHSVVEVADKVRNWPRALEQMVELVLERAGQTRVALAVVHTNAEAEARQLLEAVRHRFNIAEAMVAEAGPALAAHAGPGALGIVALQVD